MNVSEIAEKSNKSFLAYAADPLETAWVKTSFVALYVTLMIIGILENAVVVAVIWRSGKLRSSTCVFIGLLALSDIAQCLLNYPLQLYAELLGRWPYGRLLCFLLIPLFGLPFYVSVFTMLCVAIDRYRMVVMPYSTQITRRQAICAAHFVCALSAALALPLIFNTGFASHDLTNTVNVRTHNGSLVIRNSSLLDNSTQHLEYCYESWPSPYHKLLFGSLTFLLQFAMPLLITTVLHYRVHVKLSHRYHSGTDRVRLRLSTRQRNVLQRRNAQSKRWHYLLTAVVLVFLVCWLPFQCFSIFLDLVSAGVIPEKHLPAVRLYTNLVDLSLKVLTLASTCINPVLYAWLNRNFNSEMGILVEKGTNHVRATLSRWMSAPRMSCSRDLDEPTDNNGHGGPESPILQMRQLAQTPQAE